MIQNRSAADRTVEGNLVGEDIKMGVADMAHILNVVTDLYSDRELACIREYSTNALDAHIEAGVNAPIEVTTPSALSPFLTIRDFGIGLNIEDVRAIYSQYGASTKRNTNSQTGMLGLGCKSALTYADQFTVTSVKDGVRIQVVVSRNTQGASMKVVDTSDTSDPNGTSVMIPARSYNHIDQKAKDFFRYWKPGTVKLNGAEPEFMPHAKRVTDELYLLADGSYNAQSYVVMGGVPYPAAIEHGLGYGKAIVAFVNIGEVDFAPSREALMDTNTTQGTLIKVADDFREALTKSIEDDIASATTHAEAAKKRLAWGRMVSRQYMPAKSIFRGLEVPDSYKVEHDLILAAVYASKQSAHSNYQTGAYLPIPTVNGSLWVTGFDYVSFTATVRKKLEHYCRENNVTITNYVLWPQTQKPDQTWLDGVQFVDWPTIKAIKLPKNQARTSSGRIPGSYDLYQADDGFLLGVPGDDIDQENPIFWMVGARPSNAGLTHKRLLESYPDCSLVLLRAGREAKFQRLFPEAKEANVVIEATYKAWSAKIDKSDAYAYMMRHSADSRIKHLDADRLDDPEIASIKKVIDRDVSKLSAQVVEWQKLGYYWEPEDRTDVTNPLSKYVLLPDSYYFARQLKHNGDHIYRYMNGEYAAHKAENE